MFISECQICRSFDSTFAWSHEWIFQSLPTISGSHSQQQKCWLSNCGCKSQGAAYPFFFASNADNSNQANGFYGSKGISGRIPEGYTLFEKRFMAAVKRAGRLWRSSKRSDGGVQLSEWNKVGWTYHAKGKIGLFRQNLDLQYTGIWLSPDSTSLPILTLFGSTNLNSRSAHLDTELSFLMVTPSGSLPAGDVCDSSGGAEKPLSLTSLRDNLAREIDGIRSNVVEWAGETREVRLTTKIIVWLVKGMLWQQTRLCRYIFYISVSHFQFTNQIRLYHRRDAQSWHHSVHIITTLFAQFWGFRYC